MGLRWVEAHESGFSTLKDTFDSSMNIAIAGTRGIPACYGGFETFAEQLSIRLVARGHRVTVFCEARDNPVEQYRGVKLRHLPVRNVGPLATVLYDAECLWHARSGFDVIYMLGYGSSAICWLPRLRGTQVWINMDGLEWARTKWNPIARLYLRLSEAFALRTPNRIITDAAAIKTNLQSRYRKLPLCDVIPYGCEIVSTALPENLTSFGLTPGSYYLVVCRFEPENLIREIIDGFLQSSTQARLVLVGDNASKSPYVRSLARYKSDRILFTGPVYDVQRIQALRYFCRAYLHGHNVGGTNPSLLEAMGCGNVVIANENPFNREVLGDSGLFFSTRNDVSACIDFVDSGQAGLAGMKVQVVERVKQFYTWDRITDYYCELLEIVNSKSLGRSGMIQRAPISPTRPIQVDRGK
jgi:glycosyltransferase involved in cell wall biosynthesis